MRQKVTARIAKDWLFTTGYITLWYFAIVVIVNIVMKVVSAFDLPGFNGNELFETGSSMSYIFMLVIGIVLPLIYQKYYVSLGVTRKQMALGMLLAIVGLSVFMTLVNAGVYLYVSTLENSLIVSGNIALQMLRDCIIFVFYYLIGWLICWGFSCGRFITAAASILVGVLATGGASRLLGDPVVVLGADPGLLPEFALIGIMLAATCVLAFVLVKLVQRLPLKVS